MWGTASGLRASPHATRQVSGGQVKGFGAAAGRRFRLFSRKKIERGGDRFFGVLSGLDGAEIDGASAPENLDCVAEYFDAAFYLAENPDVASARVDPFEHYLSHGWREGRNPSPSFDTKFYLQKYARDVGTRCPLVHYVEVGEKSGFSTSALNQFERFIQQYSGQIEELMKHVSIEPKVLGEGFLRSLIIPVFSADDVRWRHDLSEVVSDFECLMRYLVFDLGRGVGPGPLFDGDYYCAQARAKGLTPPADPKASFLHWLKVGVQNRISPVSWYREEDYLALNPDLIRSSEWPFLHLIRHGLSEGRRFLPTVYIGAATHPERQVSLAKEFAIRIAAQPAAGSMLHGQLDFWRSPTMEEITRRAISLEPEIHALKVGDLSMMAPWQDDAYQRYKLIKEQFTGTYDNVILTPFCKLGGADFVGGVLAQSLMPLGKTILIRTDQSEWTRPDWFPAEMDTVDLSKWLQPLDSGLRNRVLYELIRELKPKNVFNVNSRTAFETFVHYGARLQKVTNLFSYYFCADRTPTGQDVGYPVSFFANILPFMTGALIDTDYLKVMLERRFCLPEELRAKLVVLRTPSVSPARETPVAEDQVARRVRRNRPTLIWAGRLDRQKRFDLVLEIARAMPDVSFQCWGKAVLDAEPSRYNFPSNITLHPPFKSYEELPLRDCEGLLYTSAWDGMPTILIEFAGLGMPIVASAVGGVRELIDETTGWPLEEDATLDDYVASIRDFLSDPQSRIARARALQDRVRERYTWDAYNQAVKAIVQYDRRDG